MFQHDKHGPGGLYRLLFHRTTEEKGLICNSLLLLDFGINFSRELKTSKSSRYAPPWTCAILIMLPFNLPEHRGCCNCSAFLWFISSFAFLSNVLPESVNTLGSQSTTNCPTLHCDCPSTYLQSWCWTLWCRNNSEEFFFFFLFSGWCYFTEAKESEWEVKTTN